MRRAQLGRLTEQLGATDTLLLHMIYVDRLPASEIAETLRINKGAIIHGRIGSFSDCATSLKEG